ncbi:MAG: GNAT family N-acetyltransferase [Solirubrobacteraceae bacterium]
MTAYDLRWAVAADRDALDDLHRRSSFVWPEDRASLEAHPDALGVAPEAIHERRVRVAVDPEGQIVGFSTVSVVADGVCELDDLFVDPGAMRQGIGRALVEDAATRALAAGARGMTVVAHPRTFGFYERVGFVVTGPAQTRFGPAARLERDLLAA